MSSEEEPYGYIQSIPPPPLQVMPHSQKCNDNPQLTSPTADTKPILREQVTPPCCSCCDDLHYLKDKYSGKILNVVLFPIRESKDDYPNHEAGKCYCKETKGCNASKDCKGKWECPAIVNEMLEHDKDWIPCESMINHIEKVQQNHQSRYVLIAKRLGKIFPTMNCEKRIEDAKKNADLNIAKIKQRRFDKIPKIVPRLEVFK